MIIPSVAATAGGFSGRVGAVLLGWLPCWKSSSACLPGRAAQAARCPLAVCGFWDLLTLPLPEASPSLDFFLIRVMDEKTVILQAEEWRGNQDTFLSFFQCSFTSIFLISCITLGEKTKPKQNSVSSSVGSIMNNISLFHRAVRQCLEYFLSLQKH